MKQEKIKTGVIGVGDCSLRRFLPYLDRHEGFELVAVADVLDENLKLPYVQKTVRNKEIKYIQLQPWERIPKEFYEGLDLAYIASPNQYHLHQTIQNLRHTFTVTEKPLVKSREELIGLIEAMEETRLPDRLFCQDHYIFKPPSLYALDKMEEIIEKYGKIEKVKATFFEEGNLMGLPRKEWMFCPSAGGGIFIDTGPHMLSVLIKDFGANFIECRKVEVFDMYNYNFQCETGFYGEFLVDGKYFRPSENSNVIMKMAKGVKNHEAKKIEFGLENADLYLDYTVGNFKVVLKPKGGKEKITHIAGQEYENLVKELYSTLTEGKKPFLNLDDAKRVLGVIFRAYEEIGGVSNMKLERTYSVIEDFVHS